MTTIQKPKKIKAGKYEYRGVLIEKLGDRFCATAFNAKGWHRVGISTLKKACEGVDRYLDIQGYMVEHCRLKMTTLNKYKVFTPSEGIFWEVEAATPADAVTEICGNIVKTLSEVIDPETNLVVYNYETFHYGINGDEKFEITSAILV